MRRGETIGWRAACNDCEHVEETHDKRCRRGVIERGAVHAANNPGHVVSIFSQVCTGSCGDWQPNQSYGSRERREGG